MGDLIAMLYDTDATFGMLVPLGTLAVPGNTWKESGGEPFIN